MPPFSKQISSWPLRSFVLARRALMSKRRAVRGDPFPQRNGAHSEPYVPAAAGKKARPTIVELDAREKELLEREALLASREKELKE